MYTPKVAAAVELNEDAQRAVTDDAEKSWKRDERAADTLLEDYAGYNADLLAQLQEQRAIDEAAAGTRAEEERLNIIYAMHVLRYAGGRDSGSFGFGNYASSYYGKGNSLTGIDTLDNYRLPSTYGYAQVGEVGAPILKLNDDGENRDRQEASLKDAQSGFDAMVQACRDSFGGRTADEQAAADAARQQVDADLAAAAGTDEAALAQAIADAEAAFADANNARQAELQAASVAAVAASQADLDEAKTRASAWFADQPQRAVVMIELPRAALAALSASTPRAARVGGGGAASRRHQRDRALSGIEAVRPVPFEDWARTPDGVRLGVAGVVARRRGVEYSVLYSKLYL